MPFESFGDSSAHYNADLYITLLGSLGQICRADQRPDTVDHDAFGVKTRSRSFAAGKTTRVIEQSGHSRSRPFVASEALREPPQQRIRSRHIARCASHIETPAI